MSIGYIGNLGLFLFPTLESIVKTSLRLKLKRSNQYWCGGCAHTETRLSTVTLVHALRVMLISISLAYPFPQASHWDDPVHQVYLKSVTSIRIYKSFSRPFKLL